ncbi:MAG: FAD-dependent oxidoreductase, partial [Clostridia bacterium]|nr:FAD-dependent oxidoreductase [Clostridia bacterium]
MVLTMNEALRQLEHETELCIVGGGLAGLCAAVAAARAGTKVTLIQDRPMLGGNCS